MSVNKVLLIGHLGQDPEIRTLNSGDKVANFSIATSESYKNKDGEKVTNTEWHRIVIFGKIAGVVEQYLKKGSMVYLEGKNKTEKYTNKEGAEVYTTKVICNSMTMLGGKNESQVETAPAPQSQPPQTLEDETEELPF